MAVKGEGKAFELVRVPDGERAAWLQIRKQGVGGSDVAAIMGLSHYRSAYSVWAEKRGLYEPDDISDVPAVHWGNVLEPVVGAEYAATHPDRKIKRVNAVCRSLSRPWAQASLDYEVEDPNLGWGVLEIKTAGGRRAGDWEDGVPVYYLTQVTHYLSVLDRPFADVAVLIGGNDYREYRIMRDPEDEAAVVAAVDGFWQSVESGTAPDITGARDDGRAVFAAHEGEAEVEEAEVSDAMRDYLAAKQAKDEAEQALTQATNRLKLEIGDRKGLDTDLGRFTWSRGTRKRLDTKRLKEEMPEVVERFTTTAASDNGIRFTRRKD